MKRRAGFWRAQKRWLEAILAAAIGAAGFPLSSSGAGSQLEWLPAHGLDRAAQLRLEHLRRSRCLPRAGDVLAPVFPGARVVEISWGREKPQCQLRSGWDDQGAVTLLTEANPEEVATWYAGALPLFRRYGEMPQALFINARISDFIWERDYFKYPNVAVRPADPAWLARGYRSEIALNRPAADSYSASANAAGTP